MSLANRGFETRGAHDGVAASWTLVTKDTEREYAGFDVAQNLLNYSETLSDASWTKAFVTISSGTGTTPPSGPTVAADKIVEDGTTNTRSVSHAVAGARTVSFYVKAAGRSWVYVGAWDGVSTYQMTAWFNLATGAAGTVSGSVGIPGGGLRSAIESVGNGWYRVSVTAPAFFSQLTTAYLGPSTADAVTSYAGTNTLAALEVTGAQVTSNSSAGPYAKTSGATADVELGSERFDVMWSRNETFAATWSALQSIAAQVTSVFVTPKFAEDFEESWALSGGVGNEAFAFSWPGGTLASFDTTPENFEDFEEEWSSNQLNLSGFAPGDVSAASFDTAPEAYEDFEEGWNNDTFYTSMSSTSTAAFDSTPQNFEDFEETKVPLAVSVDPATDTFTTPSVHGLSVGDKVTFITDGALPAGLSPNVDYWVKTAPTTTTFTVASASGGTTIDVTNSGTGTNKVVGNKATYWTSFLTTI